MSVPVVALPTSGEPTKPCDGIELAITPGIRGIHSCEPRARPITPVHAKGDGLHLAIQEVRVQSSTGHAGTPPLRSSLRTNGTGRVSGTLEPNDPNNSSIAPFYVGFEGISGILISPITETTTTDLHLTKMRGVG